MINRLLLKNGNTQITEVINYLVFGFLTFCISVLTYIFFSEYMYLKPVIANLYSWFFSVFFAFLTNRIWVFGASTNGVEGYLKQMLYFFIARMLTLLIEEVILYILITWLVYSNVVVKIVAQVVVIVLNYVISKLWIFKE